MFDKEVWKAAQQIAYEPGRQYKSKFDRLYTLLRVHLSDLRRHLRERERETLALSQQILTGSPWIAVDDELPPPSVMLAFWNIREGIWEHRGISEFAYQDKTGLRKWLETQGLSHWQYIYPPKSVLEMQQKNLEAAAQKS